MLFVGGSGLSTTRKSECHCPYDTRTAVLNTRTVAAVREKSAVFNYFTIAVSINCNHFFAIASFLTHKSSTNQKPGWQAFETNWTAVLRDESRTAVWIFLKWLLCVKLRVIFTLLFLPHVLLWDNAAWQGGNPRWVLHGQHKNPGWVLNFRTHS